MNNDIFFFFYNFAHQSGSFDKIIVFFAVYFPYVIVIAAFLFLLFHHEILSKEKPFQEFIKKWKEFFLVFFSASFAYVVAKVLKILIHHPRPYDVFPEVRSLFIESGYAMPSVHTTFFAALATAIFFYHKKAGYFFMFLAVIVGLARVSGGVHFPIDILGGFATGAVVAYLVKKL